MATGSSESNPSYSGSSLLMQLCVAIRQAEQLALTASAMLAAAVRQSAAVGRPWCRNSSFRLSCACTTT